MLGEPVKREPAGAAARKAAASSLGDGINTRKKGQSKTAASAAACLIDDRFAQVAGDGGLVKGVLAHVAALAHRDDWRHL